jgi:undecaprenyl diphosphate synthase
VALQAAPTPRADDSTGAKPKQGASGARYVAVIVDGHRRWARARGLPATRGYESGVGTALARVRDAIDLGIQELTMFSWSTENWRRPAEEVAAFMELTEARLVAHTPELARRGVQMRFIGIEQGLPEALSKRMRWAEEFTAPNGTLKLFIAFNYGGRQEIEDAAPHWRR